MKKLIVGLSIAVGAILVVEAPATNATAWTNDTVCWGLDHGASANGLVVEQMTRKKWLRAPPTGTSGTREVEHTIGGPACPGGAGPDKVTVTESNW